MPNDPSLASLTSAVLLAGFAIGALFGATAQLTRFCTMGAIADWVNFGDTTRLRMWAWAALVAMLGTQSLIAFAGLDLDASVYTSRRLVLVSLSVGGLMFGAGMVLASGCPSRALVRAGSGNLKALVVLLVVALSAQMTLRGALAAPRVEGLDAFAVVLQGPQDLPGWLSRAGGLATGWVRAGLCAALAAPLLLWLARDAEFRKPGPLLGGAVIGALVVGAWWVSGSVGFLPEHPETLEPAWLATGSRRPEALSFVAPTASVLNLLTLWSDRSTRLDFGGATLVGTLAGAMLIALGRREFRWEGFGGPRDLAQHLIGALLMGAGGVTALGCSVGQGLSGLSVLSAGSVVAVAAIAAGAWLALRYQAWVIDRS
jgi:uncharacterized membrane protein YedE/YeeE